MSDGFFVNKQKAFVDDLDFDAEMMRRALQLDAAPPDQCPVISRERLAGHPLSNGIDRLPICRRIKATIPDARILIVIREQRSMILSNYMQFLGFGGAQSIEQYLQPKSDGKVPCLSIDFWKYDRLIGLYMQNFGRERILVLPFEQLVGEPQNFIQRLCLFAGTPAPTNLPYLRRENAKQHYFAYTTTRLLSPLIRTSRGNGFAPTPFGKVGGNIHRALGAGLGLVTPEALDKRARQRLLDRIDAVCGSAFAESNRRTSDMIGADLSGYGYESHGNRTRSQ